MTTTSIKVGDIVVVDKKGRRFLAQVEARDGSTFQVTPLVKGITFFSATSREIVTHYKRMGGRA